MSAYEALASSYDRLTNDVPYLQIADYVERVLQKQGKRVETVLDLACGTGSLSCLLSQRGYRVTGVDLSEDMLTEAYQKALELQENRPLFVHQAMQRLRLSSPVDLVVCTLDSLNYLTKPDDCRETIRRVYHTLTEGGSFLFDVNTPEKLHSMDGEIFLDEDDNQYCVWRASFDEQENICYYGMDLFQRQGKHWLRSFEEHAEYAYAIDQLQAFLTEAGFSTVSVYGDRSLAPPVPGEQRVYFYAGKE